jgi:hypothetical protein
LLRDRHEKTPPRVAKGSKIAFDNSGDIRREIRCGLPRIYAHFVLKWHMTAEHVC